MARKIKWRLQFKSLNNTSCTVNIYEDGYTGNTITELTGAAVPFEIEEDDDSDLLQFIRYKTAYMRVVETTYGELDSLMPTSIRQHFVEAYYGTERVFTGFMQCQQFDNGWVAAPRELEFPLVSPLGLLDAFNFAVPSSPGLVTLGSLMNEVMIGLNPSATDATVSDYQNVIFPSGTNYLPWGYFMSSVVVCPLNSDFNHYDDASKIYSPKDYRFFVEGICACFGWIAHDTPDGIIFAQYDYSGYYQKLTVAQLSTLTGDPGWIQQLAPSFNAYYSNADDNALQSMVMPLKDLTLSIVGADVSKKELSTQFSTASNRLMGGGANFRSFSLQQVGPNVAGTNMGVAIFNTAGNLSNNGLFPIAYGKIENGAVSVGIDEFWAIKYNTSWPDSQPIMTAKFFGMMPNDKNFNCLLKLKMAKGPSMQELVDTGYDDFKMNLVIKFADKYYNISNDTLSSTIVYNAITISGSTGKVVPNKALDSPVIGPPSDIGDADGIMFNIGIYMIGAIEISLYPNTTLPPNDGDCIKVTEMSLSNPGGIDEAYYPDYRHQSEIKVGGNQTGINSAEVTVNFNNYFVCRGDNSFGTKADGPVANPPTFPYMFSSLNVLQQKVRKAAAINFNEYAAKWTYWISGWRWRMIAKSFNLRDDEYTITLARSSTIE